MKTRSQKLAQAAIQVVASWSSLAGAQTLNENVDVRPVAPPQAPTENDSPIHNLDNLFRPDPTTTTIHYAEHDTHAGRDQVDIKRQELSQFARRFPALVQSSGLLSAFAFARAKNETYAEGFRKVLAVLAPGIANVPIDRRVGEKPEERRQRLLAAVEQKLAEKTNAEEYMRLSRNALEAATWIKRYAVSSDD